MTDIPDVLKYLKVKRQIMKAFKKTPGFTALRSLGLFIQDYRLARTGSDRYVVVPTMVAGGGCCCRGGVCACDRPCTAQGSGGVDNCLCSG